MRRSTVLIDNDDDLKKKIDQFTIKDEEALKHYENDKASRAMNKNLETAYN